MDKKVVAFLTGTACAKGWRGEGSRLWDGGRVVSWSVGPRGGTARARGLEMTFKDLVSPAEECEFCS